MLLEPESVAVPEREAPAARRKSATATGAKPLMDRLWRWLRAKPASPPESDCLRRDLGLPMDEPSRTYWDYF